MHVDVVLGCSYGDEGKGKVVYHLVKQNNYDLCIRFNGSCNAGHTVYHNNIKFVLHQFPVGILHNDTIILISSDCLVDIDKLRVEMKYLQDNGIILDNRLYISEACHIITPELIQQDIQNNVIGTTGSGIGPTYAQKMLRKGLRVDDLSETFIDLGFQIVNMRHWWNQKSFNNVLLEGAQGFGLDINWTNQYPYCTSSTCTLAGAINTGFPIKYLKNIYGISKAYDTYVGALKFQPDDDFNLVKIGDIGNEYGATTGRRRQCNYLNLDNLFEALQINNCNKCIINKLDVLEQIGIFKLIHKNKSIQFDNVEGFIDYISTCCACLDIEVIFSRSPNEI